MMRLHKALRVHKEALVSFTGAGGKTAAMRRLGLELAEAGLRVLATTTTRLGLDQLDLFPAHLVAPRPAEIKTALETSGFVLAVKRLAEKERKALGYDPAEIDLLRQVADVVLVESDGSRGLPLKAPGPHEPVIPPQATHVVTVAGMWALGRPLDASSVHRPDIAARLAGTKPGSPITPATLARLLLHPEGPTRGAPAGAERLLLLNGSPDPPASLVALAQRLAADQRFAAVLLGSLRDDPPIQASYGQVSAVILAAGASTRFGSPKQLYEWRGVPLLRHITLQALAAPVQEIIVVLGAHFEEIAPTLFGLPVTLVYNPDWEAGQSTSMQRGLQACAPNTQAVLFILGDQPELPADLLTRIVDVHRRTLTPIVAPRHQGRRGNPVLFDRHCFSDLLAITGDTGGKPLFKRYRSEIAWVEAEAGVFKDIDRPGDERGLGA